MESTRNHLIQLLANNQTHYISGQRLSEELSISRAAVWKHMNELKKDGYDIEGVSNKGYRIIAFPDKLSANTIAWGLETDWLGKQMVHKESVSSTQAVAHQLAKDKASHGTVVVADEQTNGKGRADHSWHSVKHKGIWMSFIIRPHISPAKAPQLTLLTATVLADVLASYTQTTPQIKWPNDMLVNRKKLAGILTEMQAEQDSIQYVVIGIGMNINQDTDDIPEDLQHKATSLAIETSQEYPIQEIVQKILQQFERAYDHYIQYGFPDVKQKWEHYGFQIGETIQVKTARSQFKAIFMGIAEDGALIVQTKNGDKQKLYSAEIEWGGRLYNES